MKREIYKIAKTHNVDLSDYKSYRSDMGCQVLDVVINYNGEVENHSDSYFVGENGGKQKVLDYFELTVKKLVDEKIY